MFISRRKFNKFVAQEIAEALRKEKQREAGEIAYADVEYKDKKTLQGQCEKLNNFCKTGGRIRYLGLSFVVTGLKVRPGKWSQKKSGHGTILVSNSGIPLRGPFVPGSVSYECDFINASNAIEAREFSFGMLPVLEKEKGR